MYLRGANFAWVSDYAQIYLVDPIDPVIAGIEDFGPEIFDRGYHVAPNALVIYTADCLRQEIRIELHDGPPVENDVEEISDDRWTRAVQAKVRFPSGSFTLSSPSKSYNEPLGPIFRSPAETVAVQILWLQYEEDCYNIFRPKPDVVKIVFWPA